MCFIYVIHMPVAIEQLRKCEMIFYANNLMKKQSHVYTGNMQKYIFKIIRALTMTIKCIQRILEFINLKNKCSKISFKKVVFF